MNATWLPKGCTNVYPHLTGRETEAQSRTVTWPRPQSREVAKAVGSNHFVLKNSSESGAEPCALREEAECLGGHARLWSGSSFPVLSAVLGRSGPHGEYCLLSEAGP